MQILLGKMIHQMHPKTLKNHKMIDLIIFPDAGILSIASEAAIPTSTDHIFQLQNSSFKRALEPWKSKSCSISW